VTRSEPQALPGAGRWAAGRRLRSAATIWWAVGFGLSILTIWMVAVTLDRPAPEQYGFRGFEATIALPWGLVGLLIARRRPDHLLGWLLLGISSLLGVQGIVDQYPVLARAGLAPPDTAGLVVWTSAWIWVVPMSGLLIFVPLFFPDGHLPSPRWRPIAWLGSAAVVGVVGVVAAYTAPIGRHPLTRDVSQLVANDWLVVVPFLMFGAASALAVASLVRRFAGAAGEQREQIKWAAWGGVGGVSGLALDFSSSSAAQAIGIATACTGAASVGIAILRYRLYDIDVILSRTFVYGALTAILAGVYTASIALSTRLFSAVTGERSDAAIVVTTLVVVALFTPLKNRLQALVDRRLKPGAAAITIVGPTSDPVLREQFIELHRELHRGG